MEKKPSELFIIMLLGALSIVSPFAIDMYLPAYLQVAGDFGVPQTTIALTISSYFVGLAGGQLFYGPLLDRYGRKPPLYAGLGLFMLASLGCAASSSLPMLVTMRFLQALGGCVAMVAALAMVRDFFPTDQNARVLSRLFLCISVSPLLAPSVGGLLVSAAGWRSVFVLLAVIVMIIIVIMHVLMPEGHAPDPGISLKPGPILREYLAILYQPRFITYALAGGFSCAGLFAYVAGAPVIFMQGFGLSPQAFSIVFGLLAAGFIGSSQVNTVLLRWFSSELIFARAMWLQTAVSLVFVVGTALHWYGFTATVAFFFITMGCVGVTTPNGDALAMSPFTRHAGSAAAMMGFLQMGIGAVISGSISLSGTSDSLPIIAILSATSVIALLILLIGQKRAATALTE